MYKHHQVCFRTLLFYFEETSKNFQNPFSFLKSMVFLKFLELLKAKCGQPSQECGPAKVMEDPGGLHMKTSSSACKGLLPAPL